MWLPEDIKKTLAPPPRVCGEVYLTFLTLLLFSALHFFFLLVPVRASPVPSVVRGSLVVNFCFLCTCVSASARQSRAQCCARSFVVKFLEHLECSWQPHIQGRGAKKRTQRAG